MNNNAANNFNFVAGVLGFAITVVSAAAYCRSYLPGVQMKILDELLKETRTIYEKVETDNLFPSDTFRKSSLTTLVRYVKIQFCSFSVFWGLPTYLKAGGFQRCASRKCIQRNNKYQRIPSVI